MLLKDRLRLLLEDFRYESSMGLGKRGFKKHHIDALIDELTPFIRNAIDQERECAYKMGYSVGISRMYSGGKYD